MQALLRLRRAANAGLSWPSQPALAVMAALLLAACAGAPAPELAFTPGPGSGPDGPAAPTAPPPLPSTLIVCLGREPESLFLYAPLRLTGGAGLESETVLQALYDGPIDWIGFRPQPVAVESLPELAGGGARLETVSVQEGAVYLNPQTQLPDELRPGRPYLPPGCQDPSCVRTHPGGAAEMQRLTADFRLRRDLRWADGEPVTAADSVFSYRLNARREFEISKYLVERTEAYEAVDSHTVRWTGIPGFLDPEFSGNLWPPLPEHILGEQSPGDLAEAPEAARMPVGWGAFTIQAWDPGQRIVLAVNPHYFRAEEGLPGVEGLVFRFVGPGGRAAIQQLLTGECDVLDETALAESDLDTLVAQQEAGRLALAAAPGGVVWRLDFNTSRTDGQPNPLVSADVRRALAACIDRQALLREVTAGLGETTDTYLPRSHPLYAESVQAIAYDPAGAAQALESLGWLDDDARPETARTSLGAPGVPGGTRLTLRVLVPSGGFGEAIGARLQADLARCGAQTEVEALAPGALMAPWPEGPVFGRAFEVVVWPWLVTTTPACEMFSGQEAPGEDHPNGTNATGYSNPAYDQACGVVLLGLAGGEAFQQAARLSQEIFATDLPALALFTAPRLVAHRTEVCGVAPDASAFSALWNLETISFGMPCPR